MLGRDKYLSETEARKLLDHCKTKAKSGRKKWITRRAIIETLLGSGFRATECRLIRIRDLNLNPQEPMLSCIGKGSKPGTIPISGKLRVTLKKFLVRKKGWGEPTDPDDWLFLSPRGGSYSLIGFQGLFKQVAQAAGLRSVYSIHSTRHAFGMATFAKSKNIRLVQTLLRHSDISSTMVYTHVSQQELVETVNNLWN